MAPSKAAVQESLCHFVDHTSSAIARGFCHRQDVAQTAYCDVWRRQIVRWRCWTFEFCDQDREPSCKRRACIFAIKPSKQIFSTNQRNRVARHHRRRQDFNVGVARFQHRGKSCCLLFACACWRRGGNQSLSGVCKQLKALDTAAKLGGSLSCGWS